MSHGEWVWGCDPALGRLAFAFAAVDSDTVEVETLTTRTTETEGARLGLLDRQVRIYSRQAAGRFPPAVVWVEQASGRYQQPQLLYAIGALQAALFEALAVPVWTVPSSAWKKRTVGVGNATKPMVRGWVNRLGVAVESQDEADAVCIALAGRAMLRAGSWEAVA